jgi:hypothetical protein
MCRKQLDYFEEAVPKLLTDEDAEEFVARGTWALDRGTSRALSARS